MLKEFLKRIIAEVIKELLSPELEAIRGEISRVERVLKKDIEGIQEEVERVRGEISRVEGVLKKDIEGIQEEVERVRGEIRRVEGSFKKDIESLKEEIRRDRLFLETKIARFESRLDDLHQRMDTLYQVIVRRDEHTLWVEDVKKLWEDVEMLKRKVAV